MLLSMDFSNLLNRVIQSGGTNENERYSGKKNGLSVVKCNKPEQALAMNNLT